MFHQANFLDMIESISLPESAAGKPPLTSQDGRKPYRCSQGLVHANRSRQRAKEKAKRTSGTSGPSSDDSSPSACLQRSLASKLQARMAAYGSLEYVLTWKHWDMQSGPPICALRASGRRTSGSDCSGWPTAAARDWRDGRSNMHGQNARPLNEVAMLAGYPTPDHHHHGTMTPENALKRVLAKRDNPTTASQVNLDDIAPLMGWNTPRATDETHGGPNQTGGALPADAAIAGWPTPNTMEGGATSRSGDRKGEMLIGGIVRGMTLGATSSSSPVPMASSGVLNPDLSRWLMGYPEDLARSSPGWSSWALVQQILSELSRKRSEIESGS